MRAPDARLVLALGLSGCASPDLEGLRAWLRVADAMYAPTPLPGPSGGPALLGLDLSRSSVVPGEVNHPLLGSMEASGRGVLMRLADDRGHWIIPSALPDAVAPEAPTFEAEMSFSPDLPPGMHSLEVAAVDEAGRVGELKRLSLRALSATVSTGRFALVLRWDGPADLDLHVETPSGEEIWSGQPVAEGSLDADVHAGCARDGAQTERVVWTDAPSPGKYRARVDVPSLCEATVAYWTLEVLRSGVARERATGVLTAYDVRTDHQRGSGVLALEVEP
ncbi:MAG: hypothetical protein U1E65_19860 [Myxococcota bacterium]